MYVFLSVGHILHFHLERDIVGGIVHTLAHIRDLHCPIGRDMMEIEYVPLVKYDNVFVANDGFVLICDVSYGDSEQTFI